MRIEVINTGTELLLGQTLNTHAHWLGGELFKRGLFIQRQTCVPDGEEIRSVLCEAIPRCDVLLVTGGLGPTSDDITREITADLLGRPLEENAAALDQITRYLARRHRELNSHTRRQAMVPRGARVLPNDFGTAPGLYFPPAENAIAGVERSPHIFLLPGPPRELYPMYRTHVDPVLAALQSAPPPRLRNFTLFGVGEAEVSETLESALRGSGISDLGYCVKPGEVIVRCIGDEAALERCAALIRATFPEKLFTESEELMEAVVVRLLHERSQWVATAESCTGGLLADRLTNVPGASSVFGWGFVSYANAAKEQLLSVPAGLLAAQGAVSELVARSMAEGALRASGADHALAVTGIAGPDGGTAEKPVGLVFIALASQPSPTVVVQEMFPFERQMFKVMTTQTALDLLRRRLLGIV
jgi:competence/damage-inducible protein CinA-like protein